MSEREKQKEKMKRTEKRMKKKNKKIEHKLSSQFTIIDCDGYEHILIIYIHTIII